MKKIPPDAFEYYLSLGPGRSYQAVAAKYEVSKRAVVDLAKRERWQGRVAEIEARARQAATDKAVETLEAVKVRHLKALRVIQAKALEALRAMPLETAIDAVRALDLSIRQERVVLGEPGERTELSVEEVIKREYEQLMTPTEEAGDGTHDE